VPAASRLIVTGDGADVGDAHLTVRAELSIDAPRSPDLAHDSAIG